MLAGVILILAHSEAHEALSNMNHVTIADAGKYMAERLHTLDH